VNLALQGLQDSPDLQVSLALLASKDPTGRPALLGHQGEQPETRNSHPLAVGRLLEDLQPVFG